MSEVLKIFRNRGLYAIVFSVLISLLFVAYIATAATTISTNITTGGTLTVSGATTLTGITTHSQQVVLLNSTSDPSSPAEGGLYYDSTNNLIKLYDGNTWQTIASSTSGDGGLILGGSNLGVRFNTIGTGYMALGTTTLPISAHGLSGNAVLILNSTTTASIPLAIIGSPGGAQTGDLILVSDETAEVFSVDQAGTVNIASTSPSVTGLNVDGDVYIGSGGLGVGVVQTTDDALSVLGNTVLTGTLGVTGNTTLTGSLTANGAVTLGNAAGDDIIITGNASTTNSFSVGVNLYIDASGILGVGTTTPAFSAALAVDGDIHLGSSGTTTISLHTSNTSGGTCLQMVASDGQLLRIYFDNADAMVIETGPCSGGGS